MSKHRAEKNIAFKGELVKKGSEIELTAEQAKLLGNKVSPLETEDKGPTVPELKKQAEALGIDGFSTMKKDELIKAIEEKQKTEA